MQLGVANYTTNARGEENRIRHISREQFQLSVGNGNTLAKSTESS